MKAPSRIALVGVLTAVMAATPIGASSARRPPEFTHKSAGDWLNSEPLTLAQLKGKVVVVEFWAFECDNCIKSRPWVERLEHDEAGRGLVMIGVHTPELRQEHDSREVRKAVERLGIRYPVMIDEDASYWRALGIQAWPTWCLIGRDGMLVSCVPGEMDLGDARSSQVRTAIDLMLKAPAA